MKRTTFCSLISFPTADLMLWGWGMIFVDLIPGFGDAAEHGLGCSLSSTFKYSFESSALLWNFMFNFGYYITYITACYVNKFDALIGCVGSVISAALVIAVSYPIEELTPDKDVVNIALVPLTLILSCTAMVLYTRWSKDTGIYERRGALLGTVLERSTQFTSTHSSQFSSAHDTTN
jgi:hypothetical protein